MLMHVIQLLKIVLLEVVMEVIAVVYVLGKPENGPVQVIHLRVMF